MINNLKNDENNGQVHGTPSDDENPKPQSGYHFNFWGIFLIFGFGFVAGVWVERNLIQTTTEDSPIPFKNEVLQKFGREHTPPILYLQHHLNFENPQEPARIFVAAETSDFLTKFIENVSHVFRRLKIKPMEIEITPQMSASMVFENFEDLAVSAENPLIIIKNVDKLQDISPLVIHRILDPDTSPAKKAMVILAVSNLKFPNQMSKKECEIFVRKHLLKTWSSTELSEEQTDPIISRSTGIVVCLQEMPMPFNAPKMASEELDNNEL